MTKKTSASGKDYTIGAVARMTGLSTQLIRAWEQRYGAVVAERAPNGRRIYSSADLEKLGMLKALTERGLAISTIANLTTESLRERLSESDQASLRPLEGRVTVAALGALLPDLLSKDIVLDNPIDLVVRDSDPDRFRADTRALSPDVLLIELTNLDPESRERCERLRASSSPAESIVVYSFGRKEDMETMVKSGFRLLRAPVTADGLALAVLAAAVNLRCGADFSAPEASDTPALSTVQDRGGPLPARRYSAEQLSRLMRIESELDCECPRHLADLVRSLTAFEQYSAHCEDRNVEDAALHASLHRDSADARATMEKSLAHVLAAEGIEL